MQKKRQKPPGRTKVPRIAMTHEYPIGTIQAQTDLTDREGSLGVVEFDPTSRTIRVRLNVAHPGIRSAALSADHETLNYYVAEMCLMGAQQIGDWPWPHEDWPVFLTACEQLGRKVRHLDKVQ
jgi:hypothetical protein